MVDVGDHADVRRAGADGRHRPRDRLAPLCAVARDHDRLENGGGRHHRDLHAGGAAGSDRDFLGHRAVPDPARPHTNCTGMDAAQFECAVGAGQLTDWRPGDRDFDVEERLLARAVQYFAGDGARGILGAKRDDTEQAGD